MDNILIITLIIAEILMIGITRKNKKVEKQYINGNDTVTKTYIVEWRLVEVVILSLLLQDQSMIQAIWIEKFAAVLMLYAVIAMLIRESYVRKLYKF